MSRPRSIAFLTAIALTWSARAGTPQDPGPPFIDLVVQAGRPLRIALEERTRVKRVGDPVIGRLVEAIYAYDRIVLPARTRVVGRVAAIEGVPPLDRARAVLRIDFSPPRAVTVQFDAAQLEDGTSIPLRTEVRSASAEVIRQVRETPQAGLAGRAGHAVKEKASQAIAPVTKPRRMKRLRQFLLGRLPFHRQYLSAGTVYTAVLLEPLQFGAAPGVEPAPPGTLPPPENILRARLLTPLDSVKTPRGSPVQSVLTEPLFAADHRLILPEGTILSGEVTFAKAARSFRRNGQLRFLFNSMQPPEQGASGLRASLYSVQTSSGRHVALDEEGGATIANSPQRFAAPALAGLALGLSLDKRLDYDTDGGGAEVAYGHAQSQGIGGFLGLGLAGALIAQISHPAAIVFGVLGVARTTYMSVIGRGRNVSFPAETVIEVQLGPPPLRAP